MYSLLLIMKKKNVKGKWAANKKRKKKKKVKWLLKALL